MTKAFGVALVVTGVILLITGYNASQSFSSDFSRFFTGAATNEALWMLVGGAAALVAGAVLMNRREL